MPNGERIESLISPEALKQFEQLKASTDANVASFEKLVAKAVELNKIVGNATTFKEVNKATVEMTDNEKALTKQVDELAKANAKLQALYTEEAKKLAEAKLQQQARNQAIKDEIQLNQASEGSIKKKQLQLKQLIKEYDNLSEAERNSARGQELLKNIQAFDKELKQLEGSTGRFQRNVGNYGGALKILENGLDEINRKIDENTKAGKLNDESTQSLIKERELLQTLLDRQAEGFKNATAAIKGNEQAIQALIQVFGEDSEIVKALIADTGVLKDEVGDLRARIKLQASDTKVFDGLIDAAKGLTAIYSVAQGAAALFGDENEELQKTLVKLQAAMAILQGLQSIQNVLQKESAARQLIGIGLQKIAVLQTNLQTAAESNNIIVRYAAIVAQKALNLAMSAAGGPLLAVIGIITLLVLSLKSFAAQAATTKKSLEQLTAEFDRDLKALQDYSDFVKRNGDEIIAGMEAQFASERDVRKQRTKNTQEQLQAALELEKEYGYQVDQEQAKLVRVLKKNADDRTDKEKEALEKQDELIQKFREQQKKRQDLASQLRIQQSQNLQANTEETIKAQQEEIEATKSGLQTRQQLQQTIAADERKTQNDRIEALKESARIERQLINADADSQLLTKGLTPSQIKVIEAQRTAALTQARRESNKAIEDLNRSYAERERKARFDIIQLELEDQIKADDLIVQTETNSFDKRLDALYDGLQKRRAIISAQHDLDIQNDTLTAEERLAIEKKYASEINNITVEYGLQQQQLYQNNADKVNEIIAKGQQARQDKISSDLAAANTNLLKQLVGGQLSLDQFNRQKEIAEHNARVESLKEEVNNATAKVLATKEGTAERFEAEKELREKTQALNEEYYKKEVDGIIKLNELKKQLASETVQTVLDLNTAQYDRQSAAIQEQIKQIESQTKAEVDATNASTLSKEEKERRVAVVEATGQQKREALERRQRQLDINRARLEKAVNIAKIIGDTAAAIINQLKVTPLPAGAPLVAAIASIGALQLARAIAAPLPAFEHGTDDAPGGLALVGEKRKELVITPQGQVFQTPSVPTVMNVPRHSIVLPDARAAMESGLMVNRYGKLVQGENNGIQEVGKKIDTLTKVMRNKPALNMSADQGGLTAMWQYGANWIQYVEDQTKF